MRRLALLGIVGLLAALWLAPTALAAPAEKVDVCHIEGNGSYHLINISENALPAHLGHGDALPGDPVPGEPGMVFDASCTAVDDGGGDPQPPGDDPPPQPPGDGGGEDPPISDA